MGMGGPREGHLPEENTRQGQEGKQRQQQQQQHQKRKVCPLLGGRAELSMESLGVDS